MSKLAQTSSITKYIIEPVIKNLGRELESYCYHDICGENQLTTNKSGVDIISSQLELKFKGNTPIFISWATIDGWHQFSLCVSDISFCNGVETFPKRDENWRALVGNKFKSFEIYGYNRNEITLTETATGRITKEIYYNEPHLLILYFNNEKILGVGNFYLENDFIPKYPMGDDIWIIFDKTYINNYIKALSLDLLEV